MPTGLVQSIEYDNLGRVKETSLNGNTNLYHYLKNGDHASNLVSSIWFTNAGVINESLKYKYDEKGNITEILENGVLIVRYAYDSLSRLVREDNKKLNKTTIWQYDAGGNIINRFEYAYTLNDLSEKEFTKIPYVYDLNYKDKLMSYNGQTFAYDLIGNPTTYKNQTLVWEKGRQLKSFGDIASYEYNANGIRTKKIVSNTTTQYFLDGTRILAQKDIIAVNETTTTETLMQFVYGVDGIAGFILNGENYYYKKNLQGDIIGIFDNNRQIIAKYDYDSWGNFKIYALIDGIFVDLQEESTYTTNNNVYVALKNPFRYRGYYYDTETSLYYLNSRYYDAELGRFINIDDISVLSNTQEFTNGINLYAYCLNNPVNDKDVNGRFGFLIALLIGAAIGAVVGAASYSASVLIRGIFTNEWSWSWGAFLGSILGGALGGAISVIPWAGFLAGAFVSGFSTTVISDALNASFSGKDFNIRDSIFNAILAGGVSMITAGIMKSFGNYFPKLFGRGSYSQISKQIYTKLFRNQIGSITAKTFRKMTYLELYLSILSPFTVLFKEN